LLHDEENALYYKRLREVEKKEHKEAMVDVMRKQLRRLVAVLCRARPFEKRSAALSQAASAKTKCAGRKKSHRAA
jgi:hypothetical protein